MGKTRRPKSALDRKLWEAAARCDAPEVRRLLEAGANPDAVYKKIPALQMALLAGNQRETRLEDGREIVIQHDPRETAQVLIAAGADCDLAGDGWTPIMAASHSAELLRLVLPHVKHVDAVTRNGATALRLAAINGLAESVRVLLEAGAAPNVVGDDGLTALDVSSHDPAVQKLLSDAGGKRGKDTAQGVAAVQKVAARERRRERGARRLVDRWPRPRFDDAADSQAYADARARFRSICGGTEPLADGEVGECVSYDMVRSRALSLLDSHHAEFLTLGAYLFASGDALQSNQADRLSLLPTTNLYDVIHFMGTNRNDGSGPEAVCEGLQRLKGLASFEITRVRFDRLEGRWTAVADRDALARHLVEFCPDIVHQGVGTVAALKRHLGKGQQLYLWWD